MLVALRLRAHVDVLAVLAAFKKHDERSWIILHYYIYVFHVLICIRPANVKIRLNPLL